MKRLLLTGASGFLGWNLCKFQQDNWEIIGSFHQHPDGLYKGTKAVAMNLLDAQQIEKVVADVRPDAIVHMAANSSTGFCEKYPEASRAINVTASVALANICQANQIPLVFTSSEQVYDGKKDVYTDNDAPNPINTYGAQKAAAEKAIIEIMPDACIVRLAVLFGEHGPTSYCFMSDWLAKWKAGETVNAFHDEIRSFMSGTATASGIFTLLNQKGQGIYNMGGADAMSRYEFAKLLAETFAFDNAVINSMSQQDISGGDKRPYSLILDNRKMKTLGWKPGEIKEELLKLAKSK